LARVGIYSLFPIGGIIFPGTFLKGPYFGGFNRGVNVGGALLTPIYLGIWPTPRFGRVGALFFPRPLGKLGGVGPI